MFSSLGSSFRSSQRIAKSGEREPSGSFREAPPTPTKAQSWKVSESALEEMSILIPDSIAELSPEVRREFLKNTFADKPWRDLDFTQFGLGSALGLFPSDSTFQSVKFIFWTENPVNVKLSHLVVELAKESSNFLESRTSPDYQFNPVPQLKNPWVEVYNAETDESFYKNLLTGEVSKNRH